MQLQDMVAGLPPTALHYWTDSYATNHPTNILRVVPEDKRDVYITPDSTIFHPKSGGQPSDRGMIIGRDFRVQIKKSMMVGKNIVLWGKILEGKPGPTAAKEEIEWEWRYLLMRRHTAAHLFDHCLSRVAGFDVETTDSWLGDPCYAGYRGKAVEREILEKAAKLENEFISTGLAVRTETVPRARLSEFAARAPNLWRLPEMEEYRLVTIEGCAPIPCGGTHVRNVSEARGVRLEKIEQISDSFRVYFAVA